MMPLQNNVLSGGRPHPGGATTGPPQTPLQMYKQWAKYHWTLWKDFQEVVQQGQYGAYYHFLLEELASGPYWSDVRFYYGEVHEDGPGPSDPEEETGSETEY